jgi:hypothetical protein
MSDKKSMKTSNKIKSPVMKGFEAGLRSKGNFVSSCENPGAALKLFIGAEAFGDNIRVELSADNKNNDVTEIIVYRKKFSEIQELLGRGEVAMLANSNNNDNCGLNRFDLNGNSPDIKPVDTSSEWWTLLGIPGNDRYIFFGFKAPMQHRTYLRVRNGYFECGCLIQRKLAAGDTFISDTLSIKEGAAPHELLEAFGYCCAKTVPCRVTVERGVGWNSWDYYFRIFEEDDLKENIRAMKKSTSKTGIALNTLVIDDGWFNDFGDWRTNGRFPSGLEGISRIIKDSGLNPGIWLAPFNVHYFTKVLLRTPEICASCEDEKTQIEEWPFGPLRFVDPTHPEGEKFLTEIFSGLKRAGFSYFKVDFLHYLITFGKNKRFFKNDLGRMEILRLGLKIIRAAIGEDSYLLTCGCPPEAALGIADANRIGGDISTYNSTTQINSRFLATRYWMNNRLCTSDPDFLITRCDATANDTHHNPLHLNPEKGSRSGEPWKDKKDPLIWATLVGMSGGEIVLADHLGKLNKKGFEMIRTTIQNSSPDAARPLDLMEKRHPEIWFREGVKPALAVINWSSSHRKIPLPVRGFPSLKQFTGIADIWNGIKISEEKGFLTADIPPLTVAWFVK